MMMKDENIIYIYITIVLFDDKNNFLYIIVSFFFYCHEYNSKKLIII